MFQSRRQSAGLSQGGLDFDGSWSRIVWIEGKRQPANSIRCLAGPELPTSQPAVQMLGFMVQPWVKQIFAQLSRTFNIIMNLMCLEEGDIRVSKL